MSTPQQFTLQMRAFKDKTSTQMDLIIRKVVIDVGSRVIQRSPVGNPKLWKGAAPKGYIGGHFRANWQYGQMVAPQGLLAAIDKSGKETINKIIQAVKSGAAGKVHFIVNNLPYAMRLETGWSQQAPAGMVAITVAEFQGIVRKYATTKNFDFGKPA